MTTELSRFFDRLESISVGLGPMMDNLRFTNNNYPPHNIIQLSETETLLEIAVAGFKKDEISIVEDNGIVTIKGNTKTEEGTKLLYQYRGIANRAFVKSFKIFDQYKVSTASLEDGMLKIKVVKLTPEEIKVKLIPIE